MSRLADLLGCELPIQLAPMGSASASPALPLAVARAGGHAVYPALFLRPEQLAPILEALAGTAFGADFFVGLMDRALARARGRARAVAGRARRDVQPAAEIVRELSQVVDLLQPVDGRVQADLPRLEL